MKHELKTCKAKMETQNKQVTEYSQRLEEYDKKFEDNSTKFQTLLTVSVIIIIPNLLSHFTIQFILTGTEQM